MEYTVGTYCKHKGRLGRITSLTFNFASYLYWKPLRKGSYFIFCAKKELKPLTEREQLKVAIKYGF